MKPHDAVTILMVDDQPAKLLSYEAMLDDLGVNLVAATSGRAALEVLLKTEVAVVLMDVSMPEINGFELAAMIRQHPRFQQTAIIFITGIHLTDLDRLKGYELGAVDYLQVPVIPEILRAKVSVFVDLFRKTHALQELNRDLEQRVAERTMALQAALQLRDEFLGIAAHELKTPITGLRLTAQMMLFHFGNGQLEQPEGLEQRIRTINHQAERLSLLIEQVLDVTRLDRKTRAFHRETTDLVALVADQVRLTQERTNHHTFTRQGVPQAIVEIDPEGIKQALSTLLDNAIRYSPDGGEIAITIETEEAARVTLRVRDHGIGVPPEKRDGMFERFAQAHAGDHRSGLGLGLYICSQIVALHEGSIAMEHPEGGGTAIIISLPTVVNA